MTLLIMRRNFVASFFVIFKQSPRGTKDKRRDPSVDIMSIQKSTNVWHNGGSRGSRGCIRFEGKKEKSYNETPIFFERYLRAKSSSLFFSIRRIQRARCRVACIVTSQWILARSWRNNLSLLKNTNEGSSDVRFLQLVRDSSMENVRVRLLSR